MLLLGCDRPFDYQSDGKTASKTAASTTVKAGDSCYPGDLEQRLASLDKPAAAIGGSDGLSFHRDRISRTDDDAGPRRRSRGTSSPGSAQGAPPPLAAGEAGVQEAVRRVRSVIPVRAQVISTTRVENAAATAGRVMYNPRFFAQVRRHGGDSAVVGIIAHEFGHISKGHVYRAPRSPGQSQRGELEADAEAGCALARLKMDARGYVRVTAALGGGGSFTHPDGDSRAEAIQGGYARCQGQGGPLVAEAPRARRGERGQRRQRIERGPQVPRHPQADGQGYPDDPDPDGIFDPGGPFGPGALGGLGRLGDLGGPGGPGGLFELPGLGQGPGLDDDDDRARRRGPGRFGRHGMRRGPAIEQDDDAGFVIELPDGGSIFQGLAQLGERFGQLFDFLDFDPPWGYLPRDRRR
jgi:hypothetical protein